MKVYGLALAALLALAGCDKAASPPPPPKADVQSDMPLAGPELRIVALGDSLFAGYGLSPGESYPAKLEKALRASGLNARIVNAGVSGDTSQDGLARLDFTLNSQKAPPQLVLVSLGGNDLLRGLPPAQTRANLDAILAGLRQRGARIVLMGMLAPPNMGGDYRRQFDAIYPALAKKHGALLVPFFLQAVTGKPDLVQADHIHPTARGIEEIVAATAGQVERALPSPPAPLSPR